MKFVNLDLDDESLDREISKCVQDLDISSTQPENLVFLLKCIVEQLPEHLDQKYCHALNAQALISMHDDSEEVKALLVSATTKRQFGVIRRLEVLQRVRTHDEDTVLAVVEKAWLGDYSGDNHKLLLANINQMRGERRKRYVDIIQSSGTGKSRMVHELAKLVFTIPFNLRGGGGDSLAFPAADDAVRDYMITDGPCDALTKYVKLFGSIFKQVKAELDRCKSELRDEGVQTAEALAKWWSGHLVSVRRRLYQVACDNAIINHEVKLSESQKIDYLLAASSSARAELALLKTELDNYSGTDSGSIQIVLYFDDVHTLINEPIPTPEGEKSLYDVLCISQAYIEPRNMYLFTIFLSTVPTLIPYTPPKPYTSSGRYANVPIKMNAPVTETPFDCHPSLMIKAGSLALKDISTIPFMAQFGRPLFWALLRGAGVRASQLHGIMIQIAREKLLGSPYIDSSSKYHSDRSQVAILDVLLSLDYDSHRESVRVHEVELVRRNLRLAYIIPEDHETLHSGYSSEPLLAEAAARQLWTWRTKNPFVVIETLARTIEDGFLTREELGELAGRELLSSAYQRAVEFEQCDRPSHSSPNFSAGCHLTTFIEMLYTEEYANTVLDCVPDNLDSNVKFREVFKDAFVRFTHFGTAEDGTGTMSNAMWPAFIRCMAFICRTGERTINCILPVLLWDVEVCEHVMTAVLIHFERHRYRGSIAEHAIDQKTLGFFPTKRQQCKHENLVREHPLKPSERPYISMNVELGNQNSVSSGAPATLIFRAKDKESSESKEQSDKRVFTTPKEQMLSLAEPELSGHPRYSIFAYGCSPTVYRGIDARYQESYDLFSSSRNFPEKHAQQNAEASAMVGRTTMFWTGGVVNSFHWVKDDKLHAPPPKSYEGVFVGSQLSREHPDTLNG